MTPVCCTSLSMRPWKDVLPVHARMYKGGRLSTGIWRTPYSEKEPSGGIELSCSDGRREKSRPGACPHAQGSVHFPRHMADAIQREGAVRRNRAVMLRRTPRKKSARGMPACTGECPLPQAYGGRHTARRSRQAESSWHAQTDGGETLFGGMPARERHI